MTTTAELIEATKSYLYTGGREKRNKLNGAVTNTATTLVFRYAIEAIQEGVKLALEFEDVYVWAQSGTTGAIVERGQFGSTAAAHADNAIVYVNPRFSDFEIFRAITDELADLSSPTHGLFRMRTVDLTYQPTTYGYDLTAVGDLNDVYEVRADTGYGGDWALIENWDYSSDMPTTAFASGKALFVSDSMLAGKTMRVRYKAPFGALTTTSANVATDTGLPQTAMDILSIGAAIRLTAGREIRRNFDESQGDTRRAEEVPPGANLRAPAGLRQLRIDRIAAESARLSAKYPPRHRRVFS